MLPTEETPNASAPKRCACMNWAYDPSTHGPWTEQAHHPACSMESNQNNLLLPPCGALGQSPSGPVPVCIRNSGHPWMHRDQYGRTWKNEESLTVPNPKCTSTIALAEGFDSPCILPADHEGWHTNGRGSVWPQVTVNQGMKALAQWEQIATYLYGLLENVGEAADAKELSDSEVRLLSGSLADQRLRAVQIRRSEQQGRTVFAPGLPLPPKRTREQLLEWARFIGPTRKTSAPDPRTYVPIMDAAPEEPKPHPAGPQQQLDINGALRIISETREKLDAAEKRLEAYAGSPLTPTGKHALEAAEARVKELEAKVAAMQPLVDRAHVLEAAVEQAAASMRITAQHLDTVLTKE